MEKASTEKIDQPQRDKMWFFWLSIWNSSSFFHGLTVAAEHYFENDRLPLSYFLVIGLIASLLGWGVDLITKNKSLKVKKIVAAVLTVISWGLAVVIR
jgi:hypothetical protein